MRIEWVAALLLVAATPARADGKREAAARRALAGSSGKSWVREAMVMFLGGDKRCKRGETWLFRPDGNVQIDRCVDGKVVTSTSTWRVHVIDALDLGIAVDDREYVLLIPEPGSATKKGRMLLRRRSDAKADPTVDIEFTYEHE